MAKLSDYLHTAEAAEYRRTSQYDSQLACPW